jgi:hypothetical protein
MADLANAVMELQLEPDLVVTHVDTDVNMDHRLVCEAAKIVGRPKRKPVAIIGSEIPNTSFWNGHVFPANYYVDIRGEIRRRRSVPRSAAVTLIETAKTDARLLATSKGCDLEETRYCEAVVAP